MSISAFDVGKSNPQKSKLDRWRKEIKRAVSTQGPNSKTIISIALKNITDVFGVIQANKAIEEFGLKSLGWKLKEE